MDASQAVEELKKLEKYHEDPEAAHFYADQVLLKYLKANEPTLHEAYRTLRAESRGWWYA